MERLFGILPHRTIQIGHISQIVVAGDADQSIPVFENHVELSAVVPRVVAVGKHTELYENCPEYKTMVELQRLDDLEKNTDKEAH